MNTKIFALLVKKLNDAFNLPKHQQIRDNINKDTQVDQLPWTPARYRKFKDAVEAELHLDSDYIGSLEHIVVTLNQQYLLRFFGEIWKPRTDTFGHTGWALADEINKQNFKSVLDVGCGYHPYKGRIANLVGIDPFNSAADYQVDILDYEVKPSSHDCIMALGSINFNSRDEIEQRFAHCVNLLETGGKFYLRANPGISHKTGPYVDVFPWTFGIVKELEQKYNLHLDTFKVDAHERLYFVYTKL
jgi:hypothetical protein